MCEMKTIKKAVRFADSLGLKFEYVKFFKDDVPVVPKSAFKHLQVPSSLILQRFYGVSPCIQEIYSESAKFTLVPEFLQPCSSANFCARVHSQGVCLENCIISAGAGNLSVTCIIRVLNVAFEKEVTVRHSLNEWQTYIDSLASYLPNSCEGWSDKFSVTFSIRSHAPGGSLQIGQRVLFAIKYVVNQKECWDNNGGLNYSLIYKSL